MQPTTLDNLCQYQKIGIFTALRKKTISIQITPCFYQLL